MKNESTQNLTRPFINLFSLSPFQTPPAPPSLSSPRRTVTSHPLRRCSSNYHTRAVHSTENSYTKPPSSSALEALQNCMCFCRRVDLSHFPFLESNAADQSPTLGGDNPEYVHAVRSAEHRPQPSACVAEEAAAGIPYITPPSSSP